MANDRQSLLAQQSTGGLSFEEDRARAEERYPYLKNFRDVRIVPAPPNVENKGGLGEYFPPDEPNNPVPGSFAISVGRNSKDLKGGVSDTIIADMVHHAFTVDPEMKELKAKLRKNLSEGEIEFARKRYENDFKGKFTGSNFSSFDNFLNNFWLEGVVQHLLLPENSEIEQFMGANPEAVPTLAEIKRTFEGKTQ